MQDKLELSAVEPRMRIITAARRQLFGFGYQALTMDTLAEETGMSKKTLYVHFRSKNLIVEEIVLDFAGEVRAAADQVFSDERLSYPAKLVAFSKSMTARFARLPPNLFRELKRFAPGVFRHIEAIRSQTIPIVFGQILAEGQKAKLVRQGVDPVFATEFWRAAIQGIMNPETLDRLQLRPEQAFGQAFSLFFEGLFTADGIKDYEKLKQS